MLEQSLVQDTLEKLTALLGEPVRITTLEDDPEQPEPYGVWTTTDNELIGAGETLEAALGAALQTASAWKTEPVEDP